MVGEMAGHRRRLGQNAPVNFSLAKVPVNHPVYIEKERVKAKARGTLSSVASNQRFCISFSREHALAQQRVQERDSQTKRRRTTLSCDNRTSTSTFSFINC